MSKELSIGIIGCMGRMGQAVMDTVRQQDGARFVAGSEYADYDGIGHIIPGTDLTLSGDTATVFASADVVIDFSAPGSTADHATLAASSGTPLVIGTTGLTDIDERAIDAAAKTVPMMQAGNYSLGVNLLTALVRDAAGKLGDDWDIEVVEMHHRHKIDAPSGTALMLGEAAAAGRGQTLDAVRTPARDGIAGEREPGAIGFAALRGGSVIGEHDVVFASGSERLTLSHKAENRSLFAEGAVKAALWLSTQKPGRYNMLDVLGLDQ